MKAIVAALLAACLLPAAAAPALADGTQPPLPSNPNIVVVYLDDVSPHDGRLWNDPSRTPYLYDTFVAHGVTFANAIGEDPLCCPGRSNFLTGQHTHNNRVNLNRARLFDPTVHIGKSLLNAGYASFYIGKYLNNNQQLGTALWAAHDAGWTQLDVIKGVNGSFKNFTLHTKQGEIFVGGVHSTQMIADRTVQRLRETPPGQPVFATMAIYNLHGPNTPMPQDVGDPRCAAMAPWNPPNYNEADVSDKPTKIRALPLLAPVGGWPMVRYCEEMLGVDRAFGQVVEELRAEGRYDNTLFVFTADNGIAWGSHRLGQQKQWPYTTPVPLMMYWPAAAWGSTPRVEQEIVSSIDLAPTFCQLTGSCSLSGYPRGAPGPDGYSLVPLLDEVVTSLGRDAVLEEFYNPEETTWSGLRTTSLFDPNVRWHYIEYTNGERELYELVSDPWELNNLAGDPNYGGLIGTLSTRLAQLRVEGITAGTGNIHIVLDAKPNSGTDVNFSGDLGNFALDDDADGSLPREVTFAGIPSGVYHLLHSAAGWSTRVVDCTGIGVVDLAGGRLNIYLHPGEQVDCTLLNQPGQAGATGGFDASIARRMTGPFKKDGKITPTPTPKQTIRTRKALAGNSYDYWLHIVNKGPSEDSLAVRGTLTAPAGFGVTYFYGGVDVTAQVAAGTFTLTDVPVGETVELIARLSVAQGTPKRSKATLLVYASSAANPARVDVVRAKAKVK